MLQTTGPPNPLAFEFEVESAHGKCSKRLARRTLELDVYRIIGQASIAIFLGDGTAEHRRHGTVGILDGIVKRHFLLFVNGFLSSPDDFLVLDARYLSIGTTIPKECFLCVGLVQQTAEVDGLLLVSGILCIHLDEFGMSDDFLQAVYAHFSKVFAYLLGKECEVVHHILGTAFEVLAKLRVLRRHTHRTGVCVALAHHHAAQDDERQRAE